MDWDALRSLDPEAFFWADPWWLLALVPLLALAVAYVLQRGRAIPHLRHPRLEPLTALPGSWRLHLKHLPPLLGWLGTLVLVLAMARPQSTDQTRDVDVEGLDIVLALDVSTSMLAEDFSPNRLEAAKNVAQRFIDDRPNDRMGLVVFAGEAFSQCPLTTDHRVLKELLDDVVSGQLADGTAIGSGLGTAVNRLRESEATSKVVILLTDGENNAGQLPPRTAAELATTYNVRVYTIGVGTIGSAPYPVQTPFGKTYQNVEVKIDEPLLRDVAQTTGGRYFRATDTEHLAAIYDEIDKLETSRIEVTEYNLYHDLYRPFVALGSTLLLLGLLLGWTVLRPFQV